MRHAETDLVVTHEVVSKFRDGAEIAAGLFKHVLFLHRNTADGNFHQLTHHLKFLDAGEKVIG